MTLETNPARAATLELLTLYKDLVETSHDLMWQCDAAGRFTYLNPAWETTFGYAVGEMLGRKFSDFQTPDTAKRDMAVFERLLHGGHITGYETEYLSKSGLTIHLIFNAKSICDANGTLIGTRGTAHDVTERRKIDVRLRQSEKMDAIGQLAGGIAHDFNNALGGIIGYADMSLGLAEKGSVLENNLRKVLLVADRAKHLVRQILAFSQQGESQKVVTSIRPIIKEVLQLLRASIPSTVIIESELQTETPSVLADPTRIHEVLVNLATNAAHAMERKGTLTIRLSAVSMAAPMYGRCGVIAPGTYTVIEVADTGCGIDDETMSRIFEPFFTTRAVGEGSGMGLSVVLGVVQSHGGDIQVESAIGKGTTFRIFLPAIAEEDVNNADALAPAALEGAERIVFVDDEEMLVEMMKEWLTTLGYAVTAHTDSLAAMSYIREHAAEMDMLITDQTMPNMTGMELAKETLKIRKNIPIILCTGFSSEVNPERATAVGITRLVMKPYRPYELSGFMREVMDSHTGGSRDGKNSGH